MDLSSSFLSLALSATFLLLLVLLALRLRRRKAPAAATAEPLDTVIAWPPSAARVMSIDERKAYDLVRRAMPGLLVLAQVPLSRFLHVSTRHSYGEWLQRVGSLSADLLLCDAGTRVVAAIDIRAADESLRSKRRHDRMARVLTAAGIHVLTWREGALPDLAQVREALKSLAAPESRDATSEDAATPHEMPLPEIAELLAEGDRAAFVAALDDKLEPVPSAFFDDCELQLAPSGSR